MSPVRSGTTQIPKVVSRLNDLVYLWVVSRPFLCNLRLWKGLEGNGLVYAPSIHLDMNFSCTSCQPLCSPGTMSEESLLTWQGVPQPAAKQYLEQDALRTGEPVLKDVWQDHGLFPLSICTVAACCPDFNTSKIKSGSHLDRVSYTMFLPGHVICDMDIKYSGRYPSEAHVKESHATSLILSRNRLQEAFFRRWEYRSLVLPSPVSHTVSCWPFLP